GRVGVTCRVVGQQQLVVAKVFSAQVVSAQIFSGQIVIGQIVIRRRICDRIGCLKPTRRYLGRGSSHAHASTYGVVLITSHTKPFRGHVRPRTPSPGSHTHRQP